MPDTPDIGHDMRALLRAGIKAGHGFDIDPQSMLALLDAADERDRLAEENADHEASFEMHWKADQRGIAAWQAATGKTLICPDQGKLVEWLLGELDKARAECEAARKLLPEKHGDIPTWMEHERLAYFAARAANTPPRGGSS